MQNHVKPNEVCADPFAGSGSQMIAGQKAGVRTFNMEIVPKYCDVICRRYHEFTGDVPTLESTGEPFPVNELVSKE
jgi:DNA modification methylase